MPSKNDSFMFVINKFEWDDRVSLLHSGMFQAIGKFNMKKLTHNTEY